MLKRETDTHGREYALESEVKVGDILIADEGFVSDAEDCELYTDEDGETFCIKPGSELVVKRETEIPEWDKSGHERLYVDCAAGHHMLDGQWEDRDGTCEPFYLGFYPKK
jgi:hypothetical protein